MIREATAEDIPGIVAHGRKFHAMSPHVTLGEYDPIAVARMLQFMIEHDDALLLTNGTGAIGGVMAPVYFHPQNRLMEESFWWAEKGGRDLLKAFVERAREMGASAVLLSTLDNDRQGIVDRIVSHAGFRSIERRYVKELT